MDSETTGKPPELDPQTIRECAEISADEIGRTDWHERKWLSSSGERVLSAGGSTF